VSARFHDTNGNGQCTSP
jgi:excisionase family DNA binding protein